MRANNYGMTLSCSIDLWLWAIDIAIDALEKIETATSQISRSIWNVNYYLSGEKIYVRRFPLWKHQFEWSNGAAKFGLFNWSPIEMCITIECRRQDSNDCTLCFDLSFAPAKWEEKNKSTYLWEHRTIKWLVNRNIYNESTLRWNFYNRIY